MPELRECPFCGSDDIRFGPTDDVPECNNCWASGPEPTRVFVSIYAHEIDDRTRAAWNRRAGEDGSDE